MLPKRDTGICGQDTASMIFNTVYSALYYSIPESDSASTHSWGSP